MGSRISRRRFLQNTTATGVLLASAGTGLSFPTGNSRWPVGCFNRPWMRWGQEAALDGCAAAGYRLTGLLSARPEDPLIGVEATREYLDALRRQIATRGLTANMGTLRSRYDIPYEEAVAAIRKQIDHASYLNLPYVMTMGVSNLEQADVYHRLMADAAAYSAEREIQLVVKPHGGSTAASEELLESIRAVGHQNFKIWFDPGNIIYYTGKDPIRELRPVVRHVTGICAKDCLGERQDVMIEFGTGKVDFAGFFRVLAESGFDGPVMVETCAPGETPEEATINARTNREFLERLFKSL